MWFEVDMPIMAAKGNPQIERCETAMTSKPILTMVLSNTGSLQNGISGLLTTIPRISPVLAEAELGTALRLVENHQPALAILDVSMPEGKAVIRQIKEACPQIKLIVLVNNVKDQKDIEELNVDGVLLKGFPAQKLIDLVEKLIDHRGSTSLNSRDREGGSHAN